MPPTAQPLRNQWHLFQNFEASYRGFRNYTILFLVKCSDIYQLCSFRTWSGHLGYHLILLNWWRQPKFSKCQDFSISEKLQLDVTFDLLYKDKSSRIFSNVIWMSSVKTGDYHIMTFLYFSFEWATASNFSTSLKCHQLHQTIGFQNAKKNFFLLHVSFLVFQETKLEILRLKSGLPC